MPRKSKLTRPAKPTTYEDVYVKVKNSKLLSQNELAMLSSMKKNAREVNKKTIVKERRIMPTKQEVQEVVKQVKKKTDAEIERDEYSQKAISHILEVCEIAKFKPTTPAMIKEQGRKYFELCEDNTITPTSAGLARVLGLQRKELLAIVNGEVRVLYQEAYQDLWQLLEMYDEAMMKQGKVNAIVGIFNQKNNHGWTDKVEVIHDSHNDQSDEEIKKRYIEQTEIIDVSNDEK